MQRIARGDRLYLTVVYVVLSIAFIAVVYPLVYIVSSSFSSGEAVIAGRVWLWPVQPSLLGYRAVFRNPHVLMGFLNSVFYTVFGTAISVTLTVMLAYPLSRKDFVGRNLLTGIVVFTMLFSGGLIPFYLVVRNLGLIDTRWSLLLPAAVAVWQVIIARSFFQTSIPHELFESASLDGASDITTLIRIVLPLSRPVLAVLTLMYAVSQWNAYFNALMFLNSQSLFPLQIVIRNIIILNSVNAQMIVNIQAMVERQQVMHLLKYSLIVVASTPMLVLYPFIQKHFVKGVLIGSLKG